MTVLMLNIAPDVAELLGSEDAILAAYRAAELGYRCTVCGDPGQLTEDESASVVLILHEGGAAATVLRLAHGWCSDSGIRVVDDDPTRVDLDAIRPGLAWLRPHPDDPRAVLLIAPRAHILRVTAGGETIDRLTAGLLGTGFALLTDLDAALPSLDGLAVRLGPGDRLTVLDHQEVSLWDGGVVLPPGWADAARTAGRVGVVLASGLNLHDPTRDHLADLATATGDGAVIGAAGHLLTDT